MAYKAFVSSTFKDLQKHRSEVLQALRKAGFAVDPMEEWTSDSDRPKTLSVDRVDGCDLCILLVAFRRGHVPEGEKLSVTQLEYQRAVANGIDVLAFLLDEQAPWPRQWDELDKDPLVRPWRAQLLEKRTVSLFNNDPASIEIQPALTRWLEKKGRPAPTRTAADLKWEHCREPAPPEEPYPLLHPYWHPETFAGRERDLDDLLRRLRRPSQIIGVHAISGAGKSSLLQAGLIPALCRRHPRVPVAYERRPALEGVASRLIATILPNADQRITDLDPAPFVAALREIAAVADQSPVLILDQFEDLLFPGREEPRGRVGDLVSSTVASSSGLGEPLCRWLLCYRRDFQGDVSAWLKEFGLRDVFDEWLLDPFGGGHGNGLDEIEAAFLAAIQAPAAMKKEDGTPRFQINFRDHGAQRLAAAFALERRKNPQAPLVPELQVVLSHLLTQARWTPENQTEIRIQKNLEELIRQALERHLDESLRKAFPDGNPDAGKKRSRALIALRQLCTDGGLRNEGRRSEELQRRIGEGGQALDEFSDWRTRLVYREPREEGVYYVLSHDCLAQVVVKKASERGIPGGGNIDQGLLDLAGFVASWVRVFEAGEKQQSTSLSDTRFAEIEGNLETLIQSDPEREWWAACRQRHEEERRRWKEKRVRQVTAALLLLLLVGLSGIDLIQVAGRISDVRSRSNDGEALQALVDLETKHVLVWRREIEDAIRTRHSHSTLAGLLEVGPAELPEGIARSRGVWIALQAAKPLLLELAGQSPIEANSSKTLGAAFYALDRVVLAEPEAVRFREELVSALQPDRGMPAIPAQDWVLIQGTEGRPPFMMGSDADSAFPDEQPVHPVELADFRLLRHEVTNAEFGHLFRAWADPASHPPRQPAANMTWYEAYLFSAWLGGRLPTEAEWEYAARSRGKKRDYPWSDDPPQDCGQAVTVGCGLREVCSTDPRGSTDQGICDMAGSVWEWTSDWYDEYPERMGQVPSVPNVSGFRVFRGGSFWLDASYARSSHRDSRVPSDRHDCRGFRVCLPAPRTRQ